MLSEDPITKFQTKFYQYRTSFNDFQNISEEHIEELKQKFQTFFSNKSNKKLENYIQTLDMLTGYESVRSYTFDERLVVFIQSVDPELEFFKTFIRTNIIPKINSSDVETQKRNNAERLSSIKSFQKAVRDKIGFYDSELLEYETKYFRRFYSENLLDNVQKNYTTMLLNYITIVESLTSSISNEKLEELQLTADAWLQQNLAGNKAWTSSFNILYQSRLLNIKTIPESLVLFLLINDPDLKHLRIYEEESTINKIRQRCNKELGFYSLNLIRLEKMYLEEFKPEIQVSEFAKITKKKKK